MTRQRVGTPTAKASAAVVSPVARGHVSRACGASWATKRALACCSTAGYACCSASASWSAAASTRTTCSNQTPNHRRCRCRCRCRCCHCRCCFRSRSHPCRGSCPFHRSPQPQPPLPRPSRSLPLSDLHPLLPQMPRLLPALPPRRPPPLHPPRFEERTCQPCRERERATARPPRWGCMSSPSGFGHDCGARATGLAARARKGGSQARTIPGSPRPGSTAATVASLGDVSSHRADRSGPPRRIARSAGCGRGVRRQATAPLCQPLARTPVGPRRVPGCLAHAPAIVVASSAGDHPEIATCAACRPHRGRTRPASALPTATAARVTASRVAVSWSAISTSNAGCGHPRAAPPRAWAAGVMMTLITK